MKFYEFTTACYLCGWEAHAGEAIVIDDLYKGPAYCPNCKKKLPAIIEMDGRQVIEIG